MILSLIYRASGPCGSPLGTEEDRRKMPDPKRCAEITTCPTSKTKLVFRTMSGYIAGSSALTKTEWLRFDDVDVVGRRVRSHHFHAIDALCSCRCSSSSIPPHLQLRRRSRRLCIPYQGLPFSHPRRYTRTMCETLDVLGNLKNVSVAEASEPPACVWQHVQRGLACRRSFFLLSGVFWHDTLNTRAHSMGIYASSKGR
jgi:hypothetical protein